MLGYPFMLKSRTDAYDGRGNFAVMSESSVPAAVKALANRPLYAERWASFKMELAVMAVKTKDATIAFPTAETIHENNMKRQVGVRPVSCVFVDRSCQVVREHEKRKGH